MTGQFGRLLALYGREAEIRHGQETVGAMAFIQPLDERSKAAPYNVTSLGSVDDRLWLCLTRAELADGDTVRCGGALYRVASCAAVYAGRELSHWRGVLTPERETET